MSDDYDLLLRREMRARTEVDNELEALDRALAMFDADQTVLFGVELMSRSLKHRRNALEREAAAISEPR